MKFFYHLLSLLSQCRVKYLLTPLLPLLFLSSCFTGIESTKKINLTREDRKNMVPSREELYMSQIVSPPLKEWQPGKKFIVSDDKALLVIVPRSGILPYGPDSIKGRVLSFLGIESKINAAGKLTVSLAFSDGMYNYAYDTGKEFNDAMENFTSDHIPMLIDLQMVEQAKELLVGQKFWTRSNLWYDSIGNRIDGQKYVEVSVEDVTDGNMIFPLWLEIKTPGGKPAFLYMNFGNADNESRPFNVLFSLTDIRKHYPNIDDDTWEYICLAKVKEGMTKEEVRLALGNPTDLASGHDYSQTLDIWTYENGIVLWFEDGRLVKIRQ